MYEVGMYGGTFNPLHLGHVNDIIRAANKCKKLYVVVSVTKDPNEIDYKERVMWIKNITNHLDNVEIFCIFDNNDTKENYDWEQGVRDVKKHIGKPIDVVFAGSDYMGTNIWEKCYPESKIEYFDRDEIKISSTEIRKNPYKYYDYLPRIVQKHYVKKVCVIGTESCGKSTLVRNLANYFNTSYVEEVGKDICEDAGGIYNMQRYNYFDILFLHKQKEKDALEHANKVLLIDTDSLITYFYYMMDYNDKEIDSKFKEIACGISFLNDYDLYLFLEPDVKFVQDGTRMNGDDEFRLKNNAILKKLLEENNIKYDSIDGNYDDRYQKAKVKIKKLF